MEKPKLYKRMNKQRIEKLKAIELAEDIEHRMHEGKIVVGSAKHNELEILFLEDGSEIIQEWNNGKPTKKTKWAPKLRRRKSKK